ENSIFGLFIFIALFVFVIRNTNISRFIRFNVLQAILVSFMISIVSLILDVLELTRGLVGETLLNVLFLGGMAIVIYSVAQSVLGRYAEIPTISDAVNMQMPY
ncbi:MAG: Tic20 family protein, partial [Phormidesmis sp.]